LSGKKRVLTLRKITPEEALSQAVDFISTREKINQEAVLIFPINRYIYQLRVLKAPKPKT
jgi:hypothetical protein